VASYKSFSDAAKPYGALAKGLSGKAPALSPLQAKVGRKMQTIARNAASRDLGGNDSFSRWRPGKPIALATKVWPLSEGPGIVLSPERWSAGPWTVAEFGRGGGFQGPGVSRGTGQTARNKNGTVKRARKNSRYSGTTAGKNTASDAVAAFEAQLPKIIREGVFDVINEALG
jgi:hypothetical protein